MEFMNIATELMKFIDLEQFYKNIIQEENKESEYEWLFTEPILI